MPIEIREDAGTGIVIGNACGLITPADFATYRSFWRERIGEALHELFDARFGDFRQMTHGDMLEHAHEAATYDALCPAGARAAIVIPSDRGSALAEFYTAAKSLAPMPQRKQHYIFEDYDAAWAYISGSAPMRPDGPQTP